LWICGASGVGKSVTAWALFEALGDEGVRAAYVDIDQLGMLYPEAPDDPERFTLKAEALTALVPNYSAAGAEVLVVSGIVDANSAAAVAASHAGGTIRFCLLTVSDATLRARILDRGWDLEVADEAAAEAAALRGAAFVDAVVDTTRLDVAAVVARVRPLVALQSATSDSVSVAESDGAAPPDSCEGVLVYGPRAAGSSTVSFNLAQTRWRDGTPTGFVDLQQLCFLCAPQGPARTSISLGVTNVAAMQRVFLSRGASSLIVSAHLGSPAERDLVCRSAAASRALVIRLRADRDTLAVHLRERSHGSVAGLAGDDLVGASPADLTRVLDTALVEQEELDAAAAGELVVDVSGRTVDEVAAEIEALLEEGRVRASMEQHAGTMPGPVWRRVVLHTHVPGLDLRELTAQDASTYYRLVQDSAAHLTSHGDYGDEVAANLTDTIALLADQTALPVRFGVWHRGSLVGRVDLVPVDPPRFGLGYWLGDHAMHNGWCTASVARLLRHAADSLGATDIFAGVTHGNGRSVAVLMRLGFQQTERFDTYTRYHLPLLPRAGRRGRTEPLA
jgi:RimJ/RimL family protein N-acetyltransferase/broad-specificity NMP kinase